MAAKDTASEVSIVSQKLIDDTHQMLQDLRKSKGLEPWDFSKPRTKKTRLNPLAILLKIVR